MEHFWQGLADGFEMPLELCRAVWTPEVVASPNSRCFVAEEDGRGVATRQVTVTQQVAGVSCISTIPSHRGRGYGEPITARCVIEGLALGAPASHLQASAMGEPIYARMGFAARESRARYFSP